MNIGRMVMLATSVLCVGGCLGAPKDEATTTAAALTTGASWVDYESDCGPQTLCRVLDANGNNSTQMHCCPKNYAMQAYYGASSTRESLYCRQVSYSQGNAATGTDRSACHWRNTSRTIGGASISLACNAGEYMIGIHQGLGRIACCPTGGSSIEVADGPGLSNFHQTVGTYAVGDNYMGTHCSFATMHSCGDDSGPDTSVMSGLNRGTNVFSCLSN